MKFTFGDIVVVDEDRLGVVVKCWVGNILKPKSERVPNYEVYVRSYNSIKEYPETEIERYMVRHKYLTDEEKDYQYNAINGE